MEVVRLAQPEPEFALTPRPPRAPRRTRRQALFAPELVRAALKQAFVMLRPDVQWKSPVMFVVEVGAFLTLLCVVQALVGGSASQVPVTYFIARPSGRRGRPDHSRRRRDHRGDRVGIIVPFVGIKLIDLVMTALHLAA